MPIYQFENWETDSVLLAVYPEGFLEISNYTLITQIYIYVYVYMYICILCEDGSTKCI